MTNIKHETYKYGEDSKTDSKQNCYSNCEIQNAENNADKGKNSVGPNSNLKKGSAYCAAGPLEMD